MKLYDVIEFRKRMLRYVSLYKATSMFRDYNKAPKLDYDKFIDCLKKEKNNYKPAEEYYDFLINIAQNSQLIIEEAKNAQSKNNKYVAILSHACYTAIKKEISNTLYPATHDSSPFRVDYEPTKKFMNEVYNTQLIFSQCTINGRDKEYEQEK